MKLGWIGTGNMGLRMAKRLIQAVDCSYGSHRGIPSVKMQLLHWHCERAYTNAHWVFAVWANAVSFSSEVLIVARDATIPLALLLQTT